MPISEQVFSLKTRKPVGAEAPAAPAGGGDDVMDDDELLTAEDREEKQAPAGSDCRTQKKACANCTCGRAELEQLERAAADAAARAAAAPAKGGPVKVNLQDGDDLPVTGCGSCSKGDAFRCAGCPFLGKPAWSEGADGRVKLSLADDI
eukprot:TRINITY_DN192_c0_g1_i2.p3 TRINITY_DN192_c0_g1~~TRINITY_DN192_c0_g1_i2.p3  ORF type:complete len:149 (+),score=54.74 TRINITY_DN192_c0_g1_i2:88-534(+)